MTITLINCNAKLLALGIDMSKIGSGQLFEDQLNSKISDYLAWGYDFKSDQITIEVQAGETIPDLSMFGDVVQE